METCNQYYSNRYDTCIPIQSYGEQFKNYLDEKLKNIANDEDINNVITTIGNTEKNLSESLTNVETNLSGSISNVESNLFGSLVNVESNLAQSIVNATNKTVCCVKSAIDESEESINSNVNCAKEEIICNVMQAANDIKADNLTVAENVQTNLSNAITTSADNVVKAVNEKVSLTEENIISEIKKGNEDSSNKIVEEITNKIDETSELIQTNLTDAITTSANNIVKANETISKNIESNLSNAITTSADNVVKANEVTVKNVQTNLTDAITTSANNIVKANETISKNIESNLSKAITTSADNVVKANEVTIKNVQTNLSNAITTSANNVAGVVRTESADTKAKVDKLREDLIQAINNSDSLTSAGFSDLNTAIIANKEDAVYRINRHADINKKEILDAINDTTFEPYVVYGGTVLNILHSSISTITESDILKLSTVNVDTYSPDVYFSIRIADVKIDGMNDDATGELFNEAKEKNELNIVFAYPKKYAKVEIYDSIDLNITKFFEKKEITVNGEEYMVMMQCAKIINLYDPKWEVPTDYTLNYTLNIG